VRLPSLICSLIPDDLLLDPRHADLEELVEVARHDAQEAQALEQRHRPVRRLRQHPALELQERQFAVDEVIGGELLLTAWSVHCCGSWTRNRSHNYVTFVLRNHDAVQSA